MTMAQKIKRDDNVLITKGRDRGRTGNVRLVIPEGQRLIVTGVNMVKRHMKPRLQQSGGIIEREAPLPWSNVRLVCPECEKPIRPRFHFLDDGRKVRYCKKCNSNID